MPRIPENERCAAIVSTPPWYIDHYRCTRRNGHGKDGRYCKQHAKQPRYAEVKRDAEDE